MIINLKIKVMKTSFENNSMIHELGNGIVLETSFSKNVIYIYSQGFLFETLSADISVAEYSDIQKKYSMKGEKHKSRIAI